MLLVRLIKVIVFTLIIDYIHLKCMLVTEMCVQRTPIYRFFMFNSTEHEIYPYAYNVEMSKIVRWCFISFHLTIIAQGKG